MIALLLLSDKLHVPAEALKCCLNSCCTSSQPLENDWFSISRLKLRPSDA